VLEANEGELLVAAGEQAIVTPSQAIKPASPDVVAATAWTQHRLIFNAATLVEVAEEFNRYNQRRLVIQNPDLNDFHITGTFSSTDPSSLLRFLRTRPGIVVSESSSEIVVSRELVSR
jgi:transmembrane sensor